MKGTKLIIYSTLGYLIGVAILKVLPDVMSVLMI